MADEATEEILNQTDLNITELKHLIYAAADDNNNINN
jgi:hypothetical protein